ncbi:hypothetical protein M2404_002463 [Rheinheimera pacifica]|uniref:hypothetical protein n=1 Tax=Rheinheimera pacifica TaxID=173990 RepID=UPI002169A345|nr:hypothetical protein [Rheinheimera pacifica]MCS4308115.1 hypothetical protein [Rheinheimera pacifica]
MTEYSIKRRQTHEKDSFTALKQQALADIQQLAGKRWTDYNLHDPGITLLEQLCFSLTELQYRCNFPMADLLSSPDGKIDFAALGLVSPEQILSSRPTTAADYRRYLLDQIPQLADIYLLPGKVLGLYRAVAVAAQPDEPAAPLIAAIRRCYSAQRNLGEQLGQIDIITPLYCEPVAELDVQSSADPVELLAEFYYRCQQLLQRSSARRSYTDLLALGADYEQLFTGPLTTGGVLEYSESEQRQLHITDFFQPLQHIEGVVQLRQFHLRCGGNPCYDNLPLQQGLPVYYLPLPDATSPPQVRLSMGNKNINIDWQAVVQRYQQKRFHQYSRWQTDIAALCPSPAGRYRALGRYHSLQTLLPQNYGLQRPLAQSSPRQLQLKGYLLLFEQLLANFLAQLQQLPALFSPQHITQSYYYQSLRNSGIRDLDALLYQDMDATQAQLYQRLDNVLQRKHRLLDYLLALYGESLHQHSLQHFDYYHTAQSAALKRLQQKVSYLQQIVVMTRDRVAAPDHYAPLWRDAVGGFVRKQALVLDLAQTAQSLTTAVLQHKLRLRSDTDQLQQLYLDETSSSALVLLPVPPLRLRYAADSQALRRKLDDACCFDGNCLPEILLQTGIQLSNYRILLQQNRYQVLLKVPHSRQDEWWLVGSYRYYRRALIMANSLVMFLSHVSRASEGLHVMEHLLLLPSQSSEAELPATFYAGNISILCPAWTARFADTGFQQLVCETLQMNGPAHLSCRVFFLDFAQMNRFERLFKYWRSALKADRQGADKQRRALAQFLYRLNQPAEDADAPADAG